MTIEDCIRKIIRANTHRYDNEPRIPEHRIIPLRKDLVKLFTKPDISVSFLSDTDLKDCIKECLIISPYDKMQAKKLFEWVNKRLECDLSNKDHNYDIEAGGFCQHCKSTRIKPIK